MLTENKQRVQSSTSDTLPSIFAMFLQSNKIIINYIIMWPAAAKWL